MSNMSSKNPLNKKILNINKTGILNDSILLEHVIDGPVYPEHKIHLHELELHISAASRVIFKLGSQVIQQFDITADDELHIYNRDLFSNVAGANLTLSISTAANVSGQIRYSLQ